MGAGLRGLVHVSHGSLQERSKIKIVGQDNFQVRFMLVYANLDAKKKTDLRSFYLSVLPAVRRKVKTLF